MNPYNFALLFFSFCNFFISLLVLLKRRDSIGKAYFVFSIFVTIWGTAWSIVISSNASYDVALFCARLTHGSAGLISVAWFQLTSIMAGRSKKYKKVVYGFYLTAFLTLCFSTTKWFVVGLRPAVGFPHYSRPGPLLTFYFIMYCLAVVLGFSQLWSAIKSSSGEQKQQFTGFFIATLIGFVGGTFIMLPVYDIFFPQYNLFLMPVYPFIMAYFMIRHRLFDLEQIAQSFQREKLATIGLLASSINHEIRNPLYAVKGLLETYVENVAEGLPHKEPLEISKRALNQVNRALDVITKLNRFAKPAPEETTRESKASIPEALQTVLDLISYEFELDKIHIRNHLPKDLPSIQADQRQLEEILFNLIVNACHAMKGQGGVLTLSSKLETSKLILEIKDTGTGIPQDQAKHLFEPFHTTKGENGTGLGLYITKQLVERNGGKINVTSRAGNGTAVTISFPIVDGKRLLQTS